MDIIKENAPVEQEARICRECGTGKLYQFEIWEECDNPDCYYSERVECCHECAGLE